MDVTNWGGNPKNGKIVFEQEYPIWDERQRHKARRWKHPKMYPGPTIPSQALLATGWLCLVMMMTLLEIVLRQSPSLRAASLHEEIGWISITIVPCSAVKICDINNHYLHRALINMQERTCSFVQLSPSWGWAHHWACGWIASSGFSKKIFFGIFPSKTKHLLFLPIIRNIRKSHTPTSYIPTINHWIFSP